MMTMISCNKTQNQIPKITNLPKAAGCSVFRTRLVSSNKALTRILRCLCGPDTAFIVALVQKWRLGTDIEPTPLVIFSSTHFDFTSSPAHPCRLAFTPCKIYLEVRAQAEC